VLQPSITVIGTEYPMNTQIAEGVRKLPPSSGQVGGGSKLERFGDFSSRSRRVISEHRRRRKEVDRRISNQSRRGLDWTNFFMADVQVGFSSFLAFYLANLDWSKQAVGLALTVGGLASIAALIPGGALADAVRQKRGLVAAGIVMIAASALILALWPTFALVFVAEILHGATAGLVAPAIAGISLGLAGRQGMSCRVGRNFRFAAAGNVLTAAAMGVLGYYVSNSAIFVMAAILCIPALAAVFQIRPNEIDYALARNAAKRDRRLELQRVYDLTKNRSLLVFAVGMLLFHFCNASLLPVVGQNLGQSKTALSSLFMAGLIIVPQIVVAVLAPWIGYWSEIWGRKPLLLCGLGLEALRALLFTVISDPLLILMVQLLDGITAAIVVVLTILVIADVTSGSGRFNLAQGAVGTLTAISSSVSTGILGVMVYNFGDVTGFLTMAMGTILAVALLWRLLPETKPAKYDE
jgi:predicted MFS family arabinose efflux permease